MAFRRLVQYTAETRVITDMTRLVASLASVPSLPTISSSQAKTGTYSYSSGLATACWGKALGNSAPNAVSMRLGFWMYMGNSSYDSGTTYLAHIGATTTIFASYRFYLIFNPGSGIIELRRPLNNSTSEVLGSFVIPSVFGTTGTWFHVGITHFINDIAGYFSVYINGNQVFNYLGDTRPSIGLTASTRGFGTTFLNILGPGTSTSSGLPGFTSIFIDDMFIDISDSSEPDSPVPSRRFIFVLPTGTGANAQWTGIGSATNYQNVDENPNTGDTDYNKALSANLKDTFAMGDVSLPADHRIVAAIPNAFVKRLDSEIDNKISFHAFDGSIYGDTSDLSLAMSYDVPIFDRLTTRPDGGNWDETSFNAAQFGYQSRGTF